MLSCPTSRNKLISFGTLRAEQGEPRAWGRNSTKRPSTATHLLSLHVSKKFADFARFFASEACPISWREFSFSDPRDPNKTDSNSSMICDWCGRCILRKCFSLVINLSNDQFQSAGASISNSDARNNSRSSAFSARGPI